ncbi:hypothetical protein BDV24DRAFT_146848 [Aspergillus arachidicola]|uniref:Uncharacterized protein n=1 Tax=Aspergillus arachidicola TaxID=656916 RepID=A0A5N6YSF8_9EURO|nr:hypothetical protein BDV24DRAFT_146848 [Aspergillus arachidicola]
MALLQNLHLQMPGFNVALNASPAVSTRYGREGFPNGLVTEHFYSGDMNFLTVHREILMMRVMNSITDKPQWDQKVFDENITSKWSQEIAQSGLDVTPKMMNWIIKELQWKAGILNETGYVRVFDVGVIKSDVAISKDIQQALKEGVTPLNNVPEDQKDYHPRSDRKVVDLVHPSLFPVIYGRTRVLPDRIIGLNDCISSMGQGQLLPVPLDEEVYVYPKHGLPYKPDVPLISKRFQWLPCDVELTESGCRIASYINNLHPVRHQRLYGVIEKIIAQTIPLWEKSLASKYYEEDRIKYTKVEYGEHAEPKPIAPWDGLNVEDYDDEHNPYPWSDAEEDAYYDLTNAWEASRPIILPEPGEFRPHKESEWERVDIRRKFRGRRLQVIVKLANIELTPENPEYEGGSWHIEGQLNERIAASAIYYYDSENITPSTLSFRQHGMSDFWDIYYEQERHEFLQAVFGFANGTSGHDNTNVTQELGSVLCREGRLLTFPNTVQHRVSSFSLADRSKPGHRKILALFLVDPHRRIISSANVPPQRQDWLPEELDHKVKRDMKQLMTMDEAKEARLELMAERSLQSAERNRNYETGSFNLCEH